MGMQDFYSGSAPHLQSYQARLVYLWIKVFCCHFICEDTRCSPSGEAAWLSWRLVNDDLYLFCRSAATMGALDVLSCDFGTGVSHGNSAG